jgi:hypothetical protein
VLDQTDANEESTESKDAARKPYATPTLRVYGNIRESTYGHESGANEGTDTPTGKRTGGL